MVVNEIALINKRIRVKTMSNGENMTSASEHLVGLTLNEKWLVTEMHDPKTPGTGGYFSVNYFVKNLDTQKPAFLKALNLTRALNSSGDITTNLNNLTSAYNFERDVLLKCKESKMSKVVVPLDHGTAEVTGHPLPKVPFIVFEKADGDIRRQIIEMGSFDIAWILRSLHHTATGLKQLHSKKIAHQDLKPSNVLVFSDDHKVADLGRSADFHVETDTDHFQIPGDGSYAPPELYYEYRLRDNFENRFALDLYMLGSLIFFYFTKFSVNALLQIELSKNGFVRSKNFEADLPYYLDAFQKCLSRLREDIEKIAPEFANDLVLYASQLCMPDPRKRGNPRNKPSSISQHSLVTFVSHFEALAKGAGCRK